MSRAIQIAALLALAASNLPETTDPAPTLKPPLRQPDPEPEPEYVQQLREARKLRAARKMQKGHWHV